MRILGIGFLSESSVALINNGKIEFAISEERLNRKKNWWGNPFKAINFVLSNTNKKLKDINYFATHGLSAYSNDVPSRLHFQKKVNEIKKSKLNVKIKKKQINFLKKRFNHEILANKRTLKNVNQLKKKFKNLEVYDHHDAHAASAYFYSGWKDCYVLTIDGWGDNSSSKFYKVQNGNLNLISKTNTIDSLGYFYGSITKLLGFKPHRHEGKILGLAAYGNYKKAYSIISKMISYDKKNRTFKGNFEKGLYLAKFENPNISFLTKKFSSKDIAAAAQKRIEEVIIEFINHNIPKKSKIALAGGVFANVKINQKISEHKKIDEIFIFPNMGDGGLSVGAAVLSLIKHSKLRSFKLKDMYLGPKYSSRQILKEIKKEKLKILKLRTPSKYLASKIHEGKVIGCFQGRMEFGPRALGNRSIFASTTDESINKWLNNKLKRTEFMPFAPITIDKFAKKMYQNLDTKYFAAKFMTTTTKCSKKAISCSPAAIHIDNTARPQIITKKANQKIYNLLNEYYKISGNPNLINTSFNVHEEPIVCTPNDAIRAFKSSKLDYLYIGDYVIKK